MAENIQFTQATFDRLKIEHEHLTTVWRIDIAKRIEAARELGDLKENGDYHAAKEEQGKTEARIRHLEALLEIAQIVDDNEVSDTVTGGAVATVMRSFVQAHGTELSASSQALAAWEEGAPRRAVEAFHRRVFPAIEVRIDAGIRCRDDRAAVEAFDRFFQAAGLDLR